MASTTYQDTETQGRDERAEQYRGYVVSDGSDSLVRLLLDRDRTIAALRDQGLDTAAETAETIARMREDARTAEQRARDLGFRLGVQQEADRVIELTQSYSRGCDDGKRDYLVNQLGYDVPEPDVEWSVTVTASWTTYVTASAEDGPDSDAVDTEYIAGQIAGRLGLSSSDVTVDWEAD